MLKSFKSSSLPKKKSIFLKRFLCFFLFVLPLSSVYGWGPLGHQAVCDAVWRNSSPKKQRDLADAAKRMGFKTFAESCVWADKIRDQKSYAWLKPLHYVNVPPNTTRIDKPLCDEGNTDQPSCVGSAIPYFYQRLHNNDLSQRQRDEALLLLSHFIADIHQPLHVAYHHDRGGTRLPVQFEGKVLSLHSLWDGHILYCGTNLHWRDLGRQFAAELKGRSGGQEHVSVWADESLQLTRLIYQHAQQPLSVDYCQQFHPLAMERLKMASQRLWYWLNRSD